jgi:hypothetical protein
MNSAELFEAMTADDCERIFHAALGEGDTRGVEAALHILAVQDPHRAQYLMDLTRAALVIADARSKTAGGEDRG